MLCDRAFFVSVFNRPRRAHGEPWALYRQPTDRNTALPWNSECRLSLNGSRGRCSLIVKCFLRSQVINAKPNDR